MAALLGCASRLPEAGNAALSHPGAPPLAAPTRWSFPALRKMRLENGLGVHVLERPGLPLIELRLLILSGSASDGDLTGVASLAAASLNPERLRASSSRALAERIDALGASFSVSEGRDAIELALAAPSAASGEALELLAELARPPRLSSTEFEALRQQEVARVRALTQTSATWAAAVTVYAELFRDSQRHHPYAHYDALPGELQTIHPADAALWVANHFSPHNGLLVAVGATTLEQLLPLAEKSFGAWQGTEVSRPEFFPPAAPTLGKVLLVDRPESSLAELRIATLGPERRDLGWPPIALGTRILSARLDARLGRSGESDASARYAGATIEQVAFGPSPIVLGAQTEVDQAGLALSRLLADFRSLGTSVPSGRELATALAQLQARSFLDLDTTAGAAEVVTRFGLLALSEGAEDAYLLGLARTRPADVRGVAARYFQTPRTVVVVGDAARLVTPLSRFGQVHVVNPEHDFKLERVVTQDPTASLLAKPRAP